MLILDTYTHMDVSIMRSYRTCEEDLRGPRVIIIIVVIRGEVCVCVQIVLPAVCLKGYLHSSCYS